MTHLTYWYGEFNDLRSAYSFQKTSQLIPYEKGMQKTETKLQTIKKKRESSKKLSSKEHNFVKGFEEMERDRSKDPTERCGYVESNFYEEYHIFLGDEKEATPTEEKPKTEKPPKAKSASKPKITKKKKEKIKKAKDETPTVEQTTEGSGKAEAAKDAETPKPKKKTVKKKKANDTIETSRPKKKAKSGEGDDQDLKIPKKIAKKPKKVEKESLIVENIDAVAPRKGDDGPTGEPAKLEIPIPEERRLSAYEEMILLGDVSSHSEKDDGSLLEDDLSDSADEDYGEDSKAKASKKKAPKKKTAKIPKGPAKSKEPPKKKAQKTKVKVEKPVAKGEKSATNDLKKQLKKEQRKFQKCETQYLPLLRRWDKAIGYENVAELSRIYEELLTCMEDFTASFIVEYSMSDLMKRSKGYNNDLRKQVLGKFKAIYAKKKDEEPKGFTPVKESERYALPQKRAEIPTEGPGISKATKLSKDIKNEEDVVNTPNVPDTSQEVPMKSLSSSKSRSSGSNKDLASLSESKSSNSGSNKDLTSLSASKPHKNSSNKDLAALSAIKPRKSSSNKDLAALPSSKKSESKPEPSSQKQNASTGKQERKRFSLGKLMRAGSSTPTPDNTGTKAPSSLEKSSAPPSKSSTNNPSNPIWIIQVVSKEDYSNDNRTFGLEFLQQAALYVPGNKAISYDAIARNIERAIYNWSVGNSNDQSVKREKDRWNDYWNKIHDLAACIAGKRKGGTLAKMIGDGKFSSPDELIRLDDDDLWSSFQSEPLSNFST